MFYCKSASKVITQAIWSLLQKIWILLIIDGPAGFRFHLERYDHGKDRRLMGLMWSLRVRWTEYRQTNSKTQYIFQFLSVQALLKLSSLLFIYLIDWLNLIVTMPVGGDTLYERVIHSFIHSTDLRTLIHSGTTLVAVFWLSHWIIHRFV